MRRQTMSSFDRLSYFCSANGDDNVLYPASWEKKKERAQIIVLEKLKEKAEAIGITFNFKMPIKDILKKIGLSKKKFNELVKKQQN